MNILIDNAGFVNKGAELMLRSVLEEAKAKYPNGICAITPHSIGGLYAKPIGEGLFIFQDKKILTGIPQKFLNKLFYIKPSEIDMLLDAGGFQFSDHWISLFNKKSNDNAGKCYRRLKKQGVKLVFLPQAFGPFTHPMAITRMEIVFKYADLIFARDKTSYNHLIKLFGESKKIVLNPDFTNLLKPVVPLTQFMEAGFVCVIPNQKMITDTGKDISSQYLPFMQAICQFLIDKGERVILLNHEGKGDEKILFEIQKGLSIKVNMLNNLNALEVKSVIGKAKILISSRFHGVVSGLSQGVCTFSTGWSHKYEELLADYQVVDNYMDVRQLELSKQKIAEALNDPFSRYQVKQEVVKALERKSREMWDLIWSLNNKILT